MASHGQTHDDFASSISLPQLQKDNDLELLPADYGGTDSPIPFPFAPLQLSPLPAGNVYGYQQIFPSPAIHDMDMETYVDEHNRSLMNIPAEQDVIVTSDVSIRDHEVFKLPSERVDTTISGYQIPNNMMSAYHGMNRVPHFDNILGAMDRNFSSACGVGNIHMSVMDSEIQNNSRQPAEINRTFTNFSVGAAKVEQSIAPRVYENQVRVNSSQPSSSDKLDGGFLSLGYHNTVAPNLNTNSYRGNNHMSETSFSPQGQVANGSFNNVRGSVSGIQNNVGGLMTPWDCMSNLTLSADDYGLRAMTSGHDMSPISNLHGGQVNMHHYIPTPSSKTLESGIETNSRISSNNPSDCSGAEPHMLSNISDNNQGLMEYMRRTVQRVPYNSSVLRSNHQNAAELMQNAHRSPNFMSPLSGIISRESDRQDKSGQAGDRTLQSEHPRASTAGSRESLKRNIDLPPRASIRDQRRKIMPQTLPLQFSPDLLQNALGQIATCPMPASTISANSSIIPSSTIKDFSASAWTRNTTYFPPASNTFGASNTARATQHSPTSSVAFVSPIQIPTACSGSKEIPLDAPSSTMISPASFANTSTIPVIAAGSPTFASLPIDAPPTALARTVATRSGSARIPKPANKSKRTAAAAFSPSAHSPTTAPRKTHLLNTSSNNRQALSDWRKSALAALAKAAPAFRASQASSAMARIKFQGFDIPPTTGFKCMLCKRDLSFAPEGPFVQPPIPPAVAVLPCGHTFHDHCLQLITPVDREDPPCIPCAMGEK